MNMQNSSYVVEWTKNLGSWEIIEFMEISERLGIDGQVFIRPRKRPILKVVL